MPMDGDDIEAHRPQMPETKRKRTATEGYPDTMIPPQMNPGSEMRGFDPLLASANGSNDPKKEMQASLEHGKQGLGTYDYGPKEQSGEFQ